MHTIVGYCPNCGSPIYEPSIWMGIIPPPATPSCSCFPRPRTITTTGSNFIPPIDNKN